MDGHVAAQAKAELRVSRGQVLIGWAGLERDAGGPNLDLGDLFGDETVPGRTRRDFTHDDPLNPDTRNAAHDVASGGREDERVIACAEAVIAARMDTRDKVARDPVFADLNCAICTSAFTATPNAS
jgi:hypothetical protein